MRQILIATLLAVSMGCRQDPSPPPDASIEVAPRCTPPSERPSAASCNDAPGLQVARLRANFCSRGVELDRRALSVESEQVASVFGESDSSPLKVSVAPVLIGLDVDVDCRQLEAVHRDRTAHRAPNGPPGDGFDMYGVRTNIACSAGSCDASAGQLCSDEAPGWGAERRHHCIAYPLVHDALALLGYNFWDPCSAVLLLTDIEDKSRHKLTLAGRVGAAGEASNDDTLACTPAPDGVHLASAGVRASALASFSLHDLSLPRGRFYSLQMFNRNGTLRTQHDVQAQLFQGSKPEDTLPRTLHVCWRCDPAESNGECPEDCAAASDMFCAAARCTRAISQRCEDDACADNPLSECTPDGGSRDGTCDPDLWSGPPRLLSDPSCQHEPGEPAPCAETPLWIGSAPEPTRGFPLVFVD